MSALKTGLISYHVYDGWFTIYNIFLNIWIHPYPNSNKKVTDHIN